MFNQWDGSFERPKQMFKLVGKKIFIFTGFLLLLSGLMTVHIIMTRRFAGDVVYVYFSLAHHLNTVQDSLEVLSRSIRSAKSDLLRRQ